MWIFDKITITDFRSFRGKHVFEFKQGQTFLLQGVNLFDTGVDSNGSGKTSILEAIRYVIGLPVFAASITDLINDTADSTSVILEANNLKLGLSLVIEKSTPIKGSSSLSITINGEDQKKHFATISEGEKFIIKTLGVSKEDLLNHYIISREKFVSFFTSSDNDKKDLINRFSGASKIDGVEDLVQKDVDQLESEKAALVSDKDKICGKIDAYTEELNEVDEEESESDPIKDLEDKIKEKEEENKEKDEEKIVVEKKIKDTDVLVKKLNEKNDSLESKNEVSKKSIDSIDEDCKSIEKDIKANNELLVEIDLLLAGVVECPNCQTEFNPTSDSEMSIDDSRDIRDDLLTLISDLQERLKKKNERKNELNAEVKNNRKAIQENDDQISAHNRTLRSLNNELNQISSAIDRNLLFIKNTKEAIVEIKTTEKIDRKEELRGKIDKLEADKKVKDAEIAKKVDEIYVLSQWIFRFKKFRSYLANKSLSVIQGYTNLYLQKMDSNLGVRIEGFKQNKDGSIREKITPIILRNGIVEGSGSYKRYSGGERCRVDITPTLACRNLINLASPTGGVDFLGVDEITEGLDSTGLENFAQSISNIGITSIIISHTQHKKNFSNLITVEKNNEGSRIFYNS